MARGELNMLAQGSELLPSQQWACLDKSKSQDAHVFAAAARERKLATPRGSTGAIYWPLSPNTTFTPILTCLVHVFHVVGKVLVLYTVLSVQLESTFGFSHPNGAPLQFNWPRPS
jgi:hypothetical protein